MNHYGNNNRPTTKGKQSSYIRGRLSQGSNERRRSTSVVLHSQERGYLATDRNELIKILKENTDMDYSKIVDLVNGVKSLESHYPSYNLRMNDKFLKTNQKFNSILPFQWIGEGGNRKMIGIVNEGGKKSIYEHSGNHPVLIGVLNEDYSIRWNNILILYQKHEN